MEKENRWIIAVVAIAILSLGSTPSWAGSKQQYRWEGVAIGIGAAILGSALIHNNGIHVSTPAQVVYYSGCRPRYHHADSRRHGKQVRQDHSFHWKHQELHSDPHHGGHHNYRYGDRRPNKSPRSHDAHGRQQHQNGPKHGGDHNKHRL